MSGPSEKTRTEETRIKEPRNGRSEKDPLGEIQVPAEAWFGAHTARAIQNYPISGRSAHAELIRAYLLLKRAAATANEKTGVISANEADAIRKSVDEILEQKPQEWRRHFPVDPYQAGAGTSQNMNINEVVAHRAREISGLAIHPNDHVNRSQSTNDTYPTVMRMALADSSGRLLKALHEVSESFGEKARDWAQIPKSARTHLQDAVPMTLGQEFSGYASTLSKCVRRIQAAREELLELGIGGSAAGTGLTVPAGYREAMIAELSKLAQEPFRPAGNLFEAMQSQAPVSNYSAQLRVTMLELTRICNDLRLLASGPMTGLSEIELPSVQAGSSIMPGKVNPSILEMCNQTWFSVLGYDQSVAYAVQAGQLELNVMMPIMAYSLLEATTVATHALEVLKSRCIDGIRPNEERLRHYFESTPQIATALSPKLGYEKTAELVKESLKTGTSVLGLVREKKLLREEEISQLIDFRKLTGAD